MEVAAIQVGYAFAAFQCIYDEHPAFNPSAPDRSSIEGKQRRRRIQADLKVKGRWCYLYRAIDREGNLVDSMLSATRDMVREVLGPNVQHRCSAYLNRPIERDHRGVKQRYYPMLGFGEFRSAQRFGRAFEEVRQYFRPRRKQKEVVSLAQGGRQVESRAVALESLFLAA